MLFLNRNKTKLNDYFLKNSYRSFVFFYVNKKILERIYEYYSIDRYCYFTSSVSNLNQLKIKKFCIEFILNIIWLMVCFMSNVF